MIISSVYLGTTEIYTLTLDVNVAGSVLGFSIAACDTKVCHLSIYYVLDYVCDVML